MSSTVLPGLIGIKSYGLKVIPSRLMCIDESELCIKFPCRQNCQLPLHRGGVTLGAGNCRDVGREGRYSSILGLLLRYKYNNLFSALNGSCKKLN